MFILALFALAPCAHAADPTAPKPIAAAAVNLGHPVDFEKDVYPILEMNCIACHNQGTAESRLNLETPDAIRKGGKRGPAVVPKNPSASRLFQLASRSMQPAMPPLPNNMEANPLSPRELGILKQWILEGASGGKGSGGDTVQWQPIPASMHAIQSVALSPWGRFAATGRANQIVIYDVILGKEAARLVDPELSRIQYQGHAMYPGGAADRDFIHAVAFSPDESLVAAAGYRVVKLWKHPRDVETLNVSLPRPPTALAVSPDHSLAAVGLTDNTIQLRRLADGTVLRKLEGCSAAITAIQFSSDSKTIYAGSLDKSWRAWKVADGSRVASVVTPAPVTALSASLDGKQLITAGTDGFLRVWSTTEGKITPLRQWKANEKPITCLASIPTNQTRIISGSEDGSVRIWDSATGKQLSRFDQGSPVTAVAVRPDGQIVATAGTAGPVRLWQLTNSKPLAEIQGDLTAERLIVTRTDEQTIAAQHVATIAGHLQAANQDVKDRREAAKKAAETKTTAEKALAKAQADDRKAADALAASEKAAKKDPKNAPAQKAATDASKTRLAAAQAAKTASEAAVSAVRAAQAADQAREVAERRLKETESRKSTADADAKRSTQGLADARAAAAKNRHPVRTLAFSPDGNTLATAGAGSAIQPGSVQLWDAKSGRALDAFHGHDGAIANLTFAGPSSVVFAGADKKLIVWDTNPPWTLIGRIGPKSDAPLDVSASPFVSRVLCLAFRHDGKLLATGGGEPSRSGELKIWNIPSLTLARDFKDVHSDTVFGVEFSRDGKYVASGAADKFLKVSDVATGKLVRSFEGHTHHVLGVAWRADGSALATAGADNQIKIWDFESGEQQRSITSYSKQVTSIQFVGTTGDVVSCSGDRTVRLHRSNDGSGIREFAGGTDFMYSAAATPDESLVIAGGEDGILRIWNAKTGESLLTFAPPAPTKDATQANAARH